MSDATSIIWMFALGAAALGGIPYLIWMVITVAKKQWRNLVILAVIPVLAYGILLVATGLVDRANNKEYLKGIYGTTVEFGAPIFEYHSERAFNGDGYSIEIYELPDSVRKKFVSPDSDFLNRFPQRPDYREDWETETWREGPFDSSFESYLSFALSSYDVDQAPGLAVHFADIRVALKSKRTFYSFFKYDHGDHPGNVDMFIIDLESGRIYEINHNT